MLLESYTVKQKLFYSYYVYVDADQTLLRRWVAGADGMSMRGLYGP